MVNIVPYCFSTDSIKKLVHIVEMVNGFPCTIMPLHSKVILHIPEGLFGILLGNIFHIGNIVSGRVHRCAFSFHSYDSISEGSFVKIQMNVVDIWKKTQIEDQIRVMVVNQNETTNRYATKMRQGDEPPDREGIYYRLNEECVEIFFGDQLSEESTKQLDMDSKPTDVEQMPELENIGKYLALQIFLRVPKVQVIYN